MHSRAVRGGIEKEETQKCRREKIERDKEGFGKEWSKTWKKRSEEVIRVLEREWKISEIKGDIKRMEGIREEV